MRNYLGQTLISMRDNMAYEAALGDNGRSGAVRYLAGGVFAGG